MINIKALLLAGLIGLLVNALLVFIPSVIMYKIQHKFINHKSEYKSLRQIIEYVLDDKSVFIRLTVQFILSLMLFYDLFI